MHTYWLHIIQFSCGSSLKTTISRTDRYNPCPFYPSFESTLLVFFKEGIGIITMVMWIVPVDAMLWHTLESPVNLTEWDGRTIEFPFFARVLGIRTGSEENVWKRNRQYWETMDSEDPLLIYRTDLERYIGFGRVGQKAETTYFGKTYWGDESAASIFTVDDYDDSLDLSPETVNDVLGYEEGFRPHGLSKVSPDRPISELLFFLDVSRGYVKT